MTPSWESRGSFQVDLEGHEAAMVTDIGTATGRFCDEAKIGTVGANLPIRAPGSAYSFWNCWDSHLEDTHIYGPGGVRLLTRSKLVAGRWLESRPVTSSLNLSLPAT